MNLEFSVRKLLSQNHPSKDRIAPLTGDGQTETEVSSRSDCDLCSDKKSVSKHPSQDRIAPLTGDGQTEAEVSNRSQTATCALTRTQRADYG